MARRLRAILQGRSFSQLVTSVRGMPTPPSQGNWEKEGRDRPGAPPSSGAGLRAAPWTMKPPPPGWRLREAIRGACRPWPWLVEHQGGPRSSALPRGFCCVAAGFVHSRRKEKTPSAISGRTVGLGDNSRRPRIGAGQCRSRSCVSRLDTRRPAPHRVARGTAGSARAISSQSSASKPTRVAPRRERPRRTW